MLSTFPTPQEHLSTASPATTPKGKKSAPLPDLTAIQHESFKWFLQKDTPPETRKKQGLQQIFQETFPIEDINKKLIIEFVSYSLGESRHSEDECRDRGMTYSIPLKAKLRLISRESGEVREQDIYMREIPMMTSRGTFVINGAERVIVSQLHRSPGPFFTVDKLTKAYQAKIIPYRGPWIEFEVDLNNIVWVRFAKRKKLPATILLKALGYENEKKILSLFTSSKKLERIRSVSTRLLGLRAASDVVDDQGDLIVVNRQKITKSILKLLKEKEISKINILTLDAASGVNFILNTLEEEKKKVNIESQDQALISIYASIRQTEVPSAEIAKAGLNDILFSEKGYDMTLAGRYKMNRKLGLNTETTALTPADIIETVKYLLKLPVGQGEIDDIDHLGNRRVRSVGELLVNQLRIGFARMARGARERMIVLDPETVTPQTVINVKPIIASIQEFFGSSQLSQFMDQTNPLAELTHKRRLSALGKGGLSKERTGFEARDVHRTHYGRVCPIETPEGPNIGLIVSLALYAKVNEFGLIQTPYFKVKDGYVTDEIEYLSADREEKFPIAQAAGQMIDEQGKLIGEKIPVRLGENFPFYPPNEISYRDVSPKQLISASTVLIPFLEHDDANRALMGSNMQRQAVPLLIAEAPLVGTGAEEDIAKGSGSVLISKIDGEVTSVTGNRIVIKDKDGREDDYDLIKFRRSNQSTYINQRPIVNKGQKVKKGDVLTDGPAISNGNLALGRNLLVAFMPWRGYNFEDAIIVSERLVREDVFTSIHIDKFDIEIRDTHLGKESLTRDIPNLGSAALKDLDERGIIRIGAEVKGGDILAGKVTPKGETETEVSPEYKLLYSIFGEKARDVRDSSLRLPYGSEGTVIDVKVFSQKENRDLKPGVEELVQVYVATKRKISVGDKIAGRHGNKGVISKISKDEDMPFLSDGTPVDIILNSLSVPSRMNLGQILETHLGLAAHKLGFRAITPVFEGATEKEIREALKEAGYPENGKIVLYDGRTGEPFDQPVTVGYIYMIKLAHLVADKAHARSTGPYSLITQQPLGGKAQFGGQRVGEMEVWALEAYGASYCLQEFLTVKSDDITGRNRVYEAIVKGEETSPPGLPESFNVLVNELRGLCLDMNIIGLEEKKGRGEEDKEREKEQVYRILGGGEEKAED